MLKTKIDLGVHKRLDVIQEEFCFDLGMNDEGVCLLVNSKEQMLTEKLRSILKFGSFSTRYKDVFDISYLSDLIDVQKLEACFQYYIYSDEGMRENNISDIIERIEKTFSDKNYIRNLKSSRKNWLEQDLSDVLSKIMEFLRKLKNAI